MVECNDEIFERLFKMLPESEIYTVIASSIIPNQFHKGEFILRQILRDNKGKKYKRIVFIEKNDVKRIWAGKYQ